MRTVKVGTFPGEIKEYVVEDNARISDVLGLAGITVGAEQSITADGETVSASDYVGDATTILVTKRLKGAIA